MSAVPRAIWRPDLELTLEHLWLTGAAMLFATIIAFLRESG